MKKFLTLNERELVGLIRNIISEIKDEPEIKPNLIDVPHYLQSDDSTCGPASLRMIFAFYGVNRSEKVISQACKHSYELGCQGEDMVCAAEMFGFRAFIKNNSTVKELRDYINRGIPVIVDWFCGDPPEGHSSVVVGVSNKNVYILDPWLEEMRVVAIDDFRRCWFDFRETPISPDNLYVGQILIIQPKNK